jgi:hypothetical protein
MQRSLCRGRTIHIAICALLLGMVADLAYAAASQAQEDQSRAENAAAPLPPSRPPALVTPVAPAVPQRQPDQQATEDSSVAAWQQPGKLLQLPPYTRPRMHECALEWQKMKASGAATEKIWFTFARSCLVR